MSPSATLQWQVDDGSGSGFIDLTNGPPFSGVTTDTLLISNISFQQNNFNFRCIATEGNCSDTSDIATLAVKGISVEEIFRDYGFTVFPNPVSDVVQIKNQTNHQVNYIITDEIGKVIYSGKLFKETNEINLSGVAAGMYYLRLTELSVKAFKLIKD
jgi:hypothetical protein